MKKTTTIRDIAKKAGVSDATVSLAFKENSRISIETRKKIQRIAQELNYFPNISARNLRYGTSKTVGFMVNDITDPFYSRMIRVAEKIALGIGYNMIFAESQWDSEKEIKIVSNMIENRVQGVLICLCEKTKKSIQLLNSINLPHLAIDTYPSFYSGSYVVNDVINAGHIAAKHLIDRGCVSPVFFNASEDMSYFSSFRALRKGFERYMRLHKIDFNKSRNVYADLTVDGGRKGFKDLIISGIEFDGIFCVNDLCAFGAIDAAEKNGYRVGKDIAVMGIDNLETSDILQIALTSIDQPYEEIIKLATEHLISCIERNEHPDIKIKIRPTLIQRNSTNINKR